VFVHSICDSTRWFELGDLADVWWSLPGHAGHVNVFPSGVHAPSINACHQCVSFAAKDMRFIPVLHPLMRDRGGPRI